MVILNFIGGDYFLKVRGIEVLLMEDVGGGREDMTDKTDTYIVYLKINISET